ncbi:MAG TPA: hypothetical protein VKB96_08205, partial [Gammaproteobacteria bacterium]|nr:hypothetical protein [Gammaproteobacteria bacterium]
FRLLDDSRNRPVAWICGLPGAGKTTLAASYLNARQLHTFWYRLDEGDAAPATLFYYLDLAAKQAAPHKKKPLPLFTPEYLKGLPAFTRRYFRDLYARLPQPFVVVFDNYQDVGAETQTHEVMRYALEEVPSYGNVMVLSRTEPPEQLARLRVNNVIQLLGPEAMHLTVEESRGIMTSHHASLVSEEHVKRLSEQTHGWAAGLTLLSELGEGANPQPAIRDCRQLQAVFDYFAGEILRRTDSETEDVLLTTALLPTFTAPLAESLTGRPRAAQILESLCHHNYFTLRYGEAEPSYQYHPLFHDFLLARAQHAYTPARLKELKSSAANLLVAVGQLEEAAKLYNDVESWRELTRVILQSAESLLRQGRHETLAAWLEHLPQQITAENGWLLYWQGMCRLAFDPGASLPWFEQAFDKLRLHGDLAGTYLAWASAARAILTDAIGDATRLDRWIALLEEIMQIDGEFPSPQVEGIVTSMMFGSLVWRQPQHPKLHYWRERCLQFLPHISDVSRRIEQMCFIAGADMILGKDAEAACLIEQARNEMKSHKVSPLARILYRFAAAFNAWRAGFTRLAVEHAFAGLTIADRSGVHMYDYQLRNQGATGALSDGDLKTSAKLLEVPDVQFEANLGIKGSYYEYIAAWHTALKGETARALERARHAVELGVKAGTPFFEGLAHFGLSNVLHDVGDRSEASRELEVALALARRIGSQIIEFAGLMHKAWFAFEEERNADGLNHLRAALNIGASHDYYNFSWSRPPVMARLCAEALQANIETEYVQDLIRRRQLVPKKPPFEIANWPWSVKLTTLGQFEINLDDKPVVFSRKAPKKVITLLKAIIAYGGHDVPAGRLTDALWPDEEADAAHEAFAINLHRLRKLIGDDVVLLQEGRITLSAHRCWLDTWAFERLLDQAKAADTASERVALMEKALSLYHG